MDNAVSLKPSIVVAQSDHRRLTGLAETALARSPEVSEQLFAELDRARVEPDHRVGPGIVRMGSTVGYRTDGGEARTVTLVFPGEADISAGKVSILTPIGVALLGLSARQSIDWIARDGRRHLLTVESVADPA